MLIRTLGALVHIRPDATLTTDQVRGIERAWSRTIVEDPGHDAPVITAGLASRGSLADVTGSTLDELMTRLTQRVTLTAIEQRRGDLVMLHAAGLADPATGRTIALVAPSGTGKTTAARTLGHRLGYVSDETVGITADHRVEPHAKPLSIRPDVPGESNQVCADDLALLVPPEHLTIVALAVLVRDPAATSATAEPLGLTELLELVIPQVSYLPELPHGLLRVLELVAHCGGAWRLTYGEAVDLAPIVHRLLTDSAPTPSPWSRVAADTNVRSPAPGTMSVRRVRSCDAVTDGTSTVVLHGRQVVELQGVAPPIWEAAADWTSADSLVPVLTELFGAPPGDSAEPFVRRAVDDLSARGLLETAWTPRSTLLSALRPCPDT